MSLNKLRITWVSSRQDAFLQLHGAYLLLLIEETRFAAPETTPQEVGRLAIITILIQVYETTKMLVGSVKLKLLVLCEARRLKQRIWRLNTNRFDLYIILRQWNKTMRAV